MPWLLRSVIAFEALRLVCWAIFISYLAFGHSVAEGRERQMERLCGCNDRLPGKGPRNPGSLPERIRPRLAGWLDR
jgi:hypothetical protein